jgi:hypothetical protein
MSHLLISTSRTDPIQASMTSEHTKPANHDPTMSCNHSSTLHTLEGEQNFQVKIEELYTTSYSVNLFCCLTHRPVGDTTLSSKIHTQLSHKSEKVTMIMPDLSKLLTSLSLSLSLSLKCHRDTRRSKTLCQSRSCKNSD